MLKLAVSSIAAMMIFNAHAQDALPFGFQVGANVNSLQVKSHPRKHLYVVQAPKPYPLFVDYVVTAANDGEICVIEALSPVFGDDAYGNTIRNSFDALEAHISDKYGQPANEPKGILPGSPLSEPQYWSMAISQHQGYYSAFWAGKVGNRISGPLTKNILAITEEVEGPTASQLFIHVRYGLSNFAKCQKEQQSELSNGL